MALGRKCATSRVTPLKAIGQALGITTAAQMYVCCFLLTANIRTYIYYLVFVCVLIRVSGSYEEFPLSIYAGSVGRNDASMPTNRVLAPQHLGLHIARPLGEESISAFF